MSVRRNMLNVVRNYSDAEKKVREATSNDAWGPSSSLMSEIADMTYNVSAFSDIMTMIWKRVNDHGKNWRHVYKALVLLDYLIKTGSERVAIQCKENIYAIQTLKDFQFVDRDAKDQGVNVREKSKQLVSLLKDDERLKLERTRALKAKERFAQSTTGIGSDRTVRFGHGSTTPVAPQMHREQQQQQQPVTRQPATSPTFSEIEQARPQTATEEELQLKLALTMSKEEAEREKMKQESDQVRLQLAISESQKITQLKSTTKQSSGQQQGGKKTLVDLSAAARTLENPWGEPSKPETNEDPFFSAAPALPVNNDPWGQSPVQAPISNDPWGVSAPTSITPAPDPWGSSPAQAPVVPVVTTAPAADDFDPFGLCIAPTTTSAPAAVLKPEPTSTFDDFLMPASVTPDLLSPSNTQQSQGDRQKKGAENFLGDALNLVNLDSLVTRPASNKQAVNPFLSLGVNSNGGSGGNIVQQQQPAAATMSLNQMRGVPMNTIQPTMATISVAPAHMTQQTMMAPTQMMTPIQMMQPNPMFPGPGDAQQQQQFGAFGSPHPSTGVNMMQSQQHNIMQQSRPAPSPWDMMGGQQQMRPNTNNPFL